MPQLINVSGQFTSAELGQNGPVDPHGLKKNETGHSQFYENYLTRYFLNKIFGQLGITSRYICKIQIYNGSAVSKRTEDK